MRQRVFTGVVTHMQQKHGIVDQNVHFSVSAVVGRVPLVGEKVLVNAVQDLRKPVTWTAQKVQTLSRKLFTSPPPLMPSLSAKQGILGSKHQPLLTSPRIPPLIPSMTPNPGGNLRNHLQPMGWNGLYEPWGEDHGEGSSGRDDMQQKRKRWRTVSAEVPKSSSSDSSHSAPLFSCFSRDTQMCDSLELQRRYPFLQIPCSLFHLTLSWTQSFPPEQPLVLRGPCLFHVAPQQPPSDVVHVPDVPKSIADSFAVRVLLLSLPCLKEMFAVCCNLSEDGENLKQKPFMLVDCGGELRLPGGSWFPEADGTSPGEDGLTLVNTAIRCLRDQTGFDLSACTRRVESGASCRRVGKATDEDLSLPESPSLVFRPPAEVNLTVTSLSSLLEPQSLQTQESWEVGLTAELFSEMLQRDFGLQLYQSLCCLPQTSNVPQSCSEKDDTSHSPTQDNIKNLDKTMTQKELRDTKKQKLKEDKEMVDLTLVDECEAEEKHLELKRKNEGGDVARPVCWTEELPRRMLLSWVFFDRQLTGRLMETDLINILLSIGLSLSRSQAQDLVRKAAVGGFCIYRNLCHRWTNEEESDISVRFEVSGNKVLLPSQPIRDGGSLHDSSNTHMVNYKGNVVNLSKLLQSLESSKAAQRNLEKSVSCLQTRLNAAQAMLASSEQQLKLQPELKRKLEETEALKKTYEKSLRENAGQMISFIEKMQSMVEQTTTLTNTNADEEEEDIKYKPH
ncbi:hypothetical protein DNTS_029452 [Danionella cerebrum]|uniref:DBC1/CARP1 catalytically inactive NUDIX hydrolase domain-containing protein n=1 Tax=Danionella cerebrum TaxID=2873325 RepID=A0A553QDY9_9TELE|nr:hypothetical protein DNTS_029452 [Danionella translucida]